MNHHPASGILPVKAFAKTAHNDNGKFQSLALMNGHNAHRILIFSGNSGFAKILLIALKLLHIMYKMKQSPIAGLLKGNGTLYQHPHIGLTLFPSRLRRQIIAVACIFQYKPEKLMDGKILRLASIAVKPFIKCLQPLSQFLFAIFPLPEAYTRLMERPVRIPAFHKSQLHIRKVPDHRLQYCRKRNILSWIVHHPKQIQKGLYLNGSKISGP